MSWQEDIRRSLPQWGLRESSGYRSPAHNRAVGGAPGSYHTRGGRTAPGAIDVTGPADRLRQYYDSVLEAFRGRINELYLNLPGGGSQAIKGNQPLAGNPEAGRPQHLHIAIAPGGVWSEEGNAARAGGALEPRTKIPTYQKGTPPSGACAAGFCLPVITDYVPKWVPIKKRVPYCVCWSDVWLYGIGLAAALFGAGLVLRAGK